MKSRRQMKLAARSAGNGATISRTTHRFPVENLDCSACGADLRQKLRVLPGIQAIAVNVSCREIAVTYDPTQLEEGAIRQQLDALGLGCQE